MESPKSSVGSCPSPPSKMNNSSETNEDDAKWPDTGGTSSKGKRSLDDTMDIGGSTKKSTNEKLKDAISNALESVNAAMSSKEQRRKAREEASMMNDGYTSSDSSSDSDDEDYCAVIILVGVAFLLMEEEESDLEEEESDSM
ncbi:PREDICTED: uncharacterized protein LOC109167043 [Ipomoea nil]|uniref:uncharacterized protein LOC109167043 n=1 Tax=Ipomoea nil TaxID=35883 RepID=UPI0009012BD8|nr:PREDICTED: uncharacterized protein LOC109167043 [Ipomoea nil]XP_019171490.1 PREDICTED: uncharacterized protein LOC109167043 [Ipomoea nil]